jgi:hypothetical protein
MRHLGLCVALLTAGLAAAQDKKPDPAKGNEVSGKISYNGKPLPSGTVTFVSKDGKTTVAGTIAADGTYKVLLPAAEYGIAITTDPPPVKKDDKDPPKKVPVLKIPAKYGDVKTSGLLYKVAKGNQSFNIELTN